MGNKKRKINISEQLWKQINEATYLDNGSFSLVYKSRDGKNIIKVPNELDRYDMIDPEEVIPEHYTECEIKQFTFMAAHPEIFAKVKKIHSKYIIIEKLDISNVTKYFGDLVYEYDRWFNNSISRIKFSDTIIKNLNKFSQEFSELKNVNKEFVSGYCNLLRKLSETDYKQYLCIGELDIHGGNMGYDSAGELKIFDF